MPPKKRAAPAAAAAATADDTEEAFPRGGADVLTPLEKKQLAAKAQADSAQELISGGPKKKQKKGKNGQDAQDEEDLFFSKSLQQGKTYVELLKFKNITPGMKLLGVIVDVSKKGLVVSLPHGLRANVTAQEASDVISLLMQASSKEGNMLRATLAGKVPSLTDLFSAGQYVRCTILETTLEDRQKAADGDGDGAGKKKKNQKGADKKAASKKTIQASLLLSKLMANMSAVEISDGLLLPAYVRTCEEHGYTLGFGLKGVRGFLRHSDYEAVFGEGQRVPVGALLDVIIKDCSDKRTVAVSVNPMEVGTKTVTSADTVTLPSLLPGTLVSARVGKVLSDGLLVSFLTYFQGTIDKFHLPEPLPSKELKARYNGGDKVKARVLYVDPSENKVGLSLVPHVVAYQSPQPAVMLGDLLTGCTVHRIDADLGLLLQLPSGDTHSTSAPAGFVHVSNLSEEHVDNPSKVFKVGQKVSARVIGFRLLEGLAVMSMKQSEMSRQVASYKDIHPGQVLEGTAATLADYGLLLDISKNIRALVPTLHLTEAGVSVKKSKFKTGTKLQGRVLDVDPSTKRVTMTLKKGLVESKLPAFSRLEDLSVGMKGHGWVTRVQDFGVFIAFYDGLKGMAHVSDLGLTPGQKPAEVYQEGQVVRAHVLAVDLSQKRLKLSLVSSKAKQAGEALTDDTQPSGAAAAGLQPGSIVAGTVTHVEEVGDAAVYTVKVETDKGSVEGKLDGSHLSDHPAAVEELKAAVKVGTKLTQLLVLECKDTTPHLVLSRKHSMIAAAHNLPRTFDQVKETALLPGYVASITQDAVYVRYLGRVTGRAGLAQLADTFVSVPSSYYKVGQSVISVVVTVDATRQRFTVSLKPSLVSAPNAAYLHSLFRDLELAEQLRAAEDIEVDGNPEVDWAGAFAIGNVVTGQAHEMKEFGLMCDLEAHPDLVGLVFPQHVPEGIKIGSTITGRVIDVSKGEGIVDITLLPKWMATDQPAKKKKSKKTETNTATADHSLKVGGECEVEVIAVKEHYSVVALPEQGNALGYMSLEDFNKPEPSSTAEEKLTIGKKLKAVVAALPAPDNGGRMLLVPATASPQDKSSSRKRKADHDEEARKKQRAEERAQLKKGSVVEGTVQSVSPTGLCVMCGVHLGRVHASEVDEWDAKAYQKGQTVQAVVLGKAPKAQSGKRRYAVDLSLRKATLAAATAGQDVEPIVSHNPAPGSQIPAFVTSVQSDHLEVSVTTNRQAHIALWDAAQSVDEARRFKQLFKPGQQLSCRVLRAEAKGKMDLSLRDVDSGSNTGSCTQLKPGMLAVGQIKSAKGTGVHVALGKKLSGRVAVTDLQDVWKDNVLDGLKAGKYVVCRVLETLKEDKVGWVSLRPSQGGEVENGEVAVDGEEVQELTPEEVKPGQTLPAYVKAVVPGKGVFVVLSRGVEARIKLKDLADRYVKEPEKEFPPGRLVRGRVVSVESDGRIEMSLKSTDGGNNATQWVTAAQLKEGDIITGKVRNVREFGVFVEVSSSSVVGLAHISECSDDFIQDITELFKVGQAVRAVVTKVDTETQKVSLSLKKSSVELAQQAAETAGGEEDDKEEDMEAELADALEGEDDSDVDMDKEEGAGDGSAEDEDEDGGEDDEDGTDEDDDNADDVLKQLKAVFGKAAVDADEDDEEDDEDEDGSSEEEDDSDGGLQNGRAKVNGKLNGSLGADSEDEDDGEDDDDDEDDDEDDEDGDEEEDGGQPTAGGDKSDEGNTAGMLYTMLQQGPMSRGWEEVELDTKPGSKGEENESDEKSKKAMSSRKLKQLHQEKEKKIHQAEMARLQGQREPQSIDDCEQLVVASPNDSFAWIKYLAFLISLGDIDKARAVAERAIQTINYRQEDEKFNVWVAWLNMENLYGQPDPDEAAMKLFNRALAYTDQKKLYLAFCGILQRSNKTQPLEQVTKAMLKKFSASAKVWLMYVERLIRSGSRDTLTATLDRATKCLPQRKHVKLMSKAALLEFKLGDAERGRSMMEGILLNYPKRLDLWTLYLDQEIKQGDKQRVRGLFERVTHLQLPAKKMQSVFKKYLAYEKQFGDAVSVEHVKKSAMEFVDKTMGV